MNRMISRIRHGSFLAALVAVSLTMVAENAFGLGFTLTQIGGTAVNGQGVVGDTITVAVGLHDR